MNEKYWTEYRKYLTCQLKQLEKRKNLDEYLTNAEKHEAIISMAEKIGIKATARYFNITPSTVRYWMNK